MIIKSIKKSLAVLKAPSKAQQELDRTKITISFGILSFQLALMLFLISGEKASTFNVMFNGFFRFVVAYSIFLLFLFILCTASFYKTSRKNILDFLKVDQEKKDSLFDEAIEWSFVGSIMVGAGYLAELPSKVIDVSRCGEAWWSITTCYAGGISLFLFGFLFLKALFKSLEKK